MTEDQQAYAETLPQELMVQWLCAPERCGQEEDEDV